MNSPAQRLGVWSSSLAALTFVIFTLCFAAIAATQPLFLWTNLGDFVAYRQAYGDRFATVAQSAMLCFGVLYLVLLNCLYEMTPDGQRLFVRIALCLGVGFAALTGLHYFVQISAVRVNLAQGDIAGIEQFLQAKPYSVSAAANMLGWTLFFGGSSLFVAPIFSGSKRRRVLRLLFWFNGVCCLLAGVGYVFAWAALVFVTINLGMGGAVMALTVLLAFEFAGQRAGTM
ncbi:MAG: hypothetical protein IT329_04480 [Caldilineaceae bacterium]|nr:hypothetical protein [Caldilineaceae bacterium]